MRKGCLFIEILVCLKEINLKRCVRYFLPQNLQNCHNSWRYVAYRSFSVSFTLILFVRYFCNWIGAKPSTLRENIKNSFNFGFTVYLQSIVLLPDTKLSQFVALRCLSQFFSQFYTNLIRVILLQLNSSKTNHSSRKHKKYFQLRFHSLPTIHRLAARYKEQYLTRWNPRSWIS